MTTTSVAAKASDAFVDIMLGIEAGRRIVSIDSDTPLMRKQTETHATVRALTSLANDFVLHIRVEGASSFLSSPNLFEYGCFLEFLFSSFAVLC